MFGELGLLGLFLASFLAATFLPFSSEAVLALMVRDYNLTLVIIIAGVGNILGGVLNYFVGHLGKIEWAEKYLKMSHENTMKWQYRIRRHGSLLALLCWTPIIGDPISLALGYFKVPFMRVLLFMSIGKVARYLVIAYLMT